MPPSATTRRACRSPVARRDVVAAASLASSPASTRANSAFSPSRSAAGGGRSDDGIDPASGFRVRKKPGDPISKGEPLLTVALGKTANPDDVVLPTRRRLLRDRPARNARLAPPAGRRAALTRRRSRSGAGGPQGKRPA